MGAVLRRGSRLGKYRLERRIGQGAFADVWAARDTVEARRVALKIAWPEMVEAHGRDGVEREARIASMLEHRNVVAVCNADWIDGRFVLATELAKTNLAEYKAARRSPQTALRIVRDVAAGLAYAHRQRLVHRDVKPDNILIFHDGRAALTDFGVSKLKTGDTRKRFTEAGTLGYMAPEQAYGQPSFSSDVFSVGLIAYELLTGKCPSWPFDWPAEGHRQFVAKVPGPVQPVLRRACSFDPKKRYADGQQFHRALEAAFDKVETPRPRRRKPRRAAAVASPLEVQSEVFRKRHGKGLELRFACRRCGGAIAEAMAHCPWCGTHDNSFSELTRAPLICPDCERGVEAEWTSCPWCYKGRFQGNGRPPRKDPKAVRSCAKSGCAGQLRPFMRYCPLCKTKPRRQPSHAELPDRCPRCRWPVSRSFWPFCPWCRRREPKAARFAK